MRHEIKLTVPPRSDVHGEGFRFCRGKFLRIGGLPEGVTTCYLVFTDTLDKFSYRIKRPLSTTVLGWRNGELHSTVESRANLAGLRGEPLYSMTRQKMSAMYKEGYRGVHLEYDVEN